MKHLKSLFLAIIWLASWTGWGQVAINSTGNEPDPSAILDVQSQNQGILVPRMSAAERDAISNPALGLLVFVTDLNSFWYYDGQQWTLASADHLGNHIATQNIRTNGHWLSPDGTDKGIYLYSDGWVGINTDTSSPRAMLHLRGHDPDLMLNMIPGGTASMVETRYAYDDTIRVNLFYKVNEKNFYFQHRMDAENVEEGRFIFVVDGGHALVIQPNKFVGIGRTNPEFMLDVEGSARFAKELYFFSDSANTGYRRWIKFKEGRNYGDNIYIGAGGFTVIGGGEAANTYDVNTDNHSGREYLVLISDERGDQPAIQFITNTQDGWEARIYPMTILGNGKIGMGTTAPEAQLHVFLKEGEQNVRFERSEDTQVGASLAGRRSRGTPDQKTALIENDVITGINAWAYDGEKYLPVAHMRAYVDGAVSVDDAPSRWEIYTREAGANAPTLRMVIKHDGLVGVGKKNPQAKLHVLLTNEKNVRFERIRDANSGASLAGWRARGTQTAKAAVQDGDVITGLIGKGFDGSDYFTAARIRYYVDGTVSSSSVPAKIELATTPEGGAGPYPRMTIRANGKVGVGTTQPEAKFHLKESVNNDWAAIIQNGGGQGYGLKIQSSAADAVPVLGIYDNYGAEVMRVQSNGKTGFGIPAPQRTVSKT